MGSLPPPDDLIDPTPATEPEPTVPEYVAVPAPPPAAQEVPTINTKPAAGVFTGSVCVLGLSLLSRFSPYEPTVEEATSITVIVSGLAMWLIPSNIRARLNGEQA